MKGWVAMAALATLATMAILVAVYKLNDPIQEPTPVSTAPQVKGIAVTYLQDPKNFALQVACLGVRINAIDPDHWNFSSMTATYQGNGAWLVANHRCTMAISDKTGEVIGR